MMDVAERLEYYRASSRELRNVIRQLRTLGTAAPEAMLCPIEERLQELEDAERGCLEQLRSLHGGPRWLRRARQRRWSCWPLWRC